MEEGASALFELSPFFSTSRLRGGSIAGPDAEEMGSTGEPAHPNPQPHCCTAAQYQSPEALFSKMRVQPCGCGKSGILATSLIRRRLTFQSPGMEETHKCSLRSDFAQPPARWLNPARREIGVDRTNTANQQDLSVVPQTGRF